jgi:hypothetical protein
METMRRTSSLKEPISLQLDVPGDIETWKVLIQEFEPSLAGIEGLLAGKRMVRLGREPVDGIEGIVISYFEKGDMVLLKITRLPLDVPPKDQG